MYPIKKVIFQVEIKTIIKNKTLDKTDDSINGEVERILIIN